MGWVVVLSGLSIAGISAGGSSSSKTSEKASKRSSGRDTLVGVVWGWGVPWDVCSVGSSSSLYSDRSSSQATELRLVMKDSSMRSATVFSARAGVVSRES